MFRNAFLFTLFAFALMLSACDPGSGPGGLGDVRDDIAGEYYAELLDSEYTCPPNLYMPAPYEQMTVYVEQWCTDPEVCTPEEMEAGFAIHFMLRQDESASWDFNSYVMVSSSGEFDTAYTLHFLDGTQAEVVLSGFVRHDELDATYTVDVSSGTCLMAATVHGDRIPEVD